MKLTLRKGTVIEIIKTGVYRIKDDFNGNIIFIILTKKQRHQGITLDKGELVYIVVTLINLNRGWLHTEGNLKGLQYKGNLTLDKEKLDKGIDPLDDDS